MKPNHTCHETRPARIVTYSGNVVDLSAPDPESITMADVVHHLAGIARFGGALRNGVNENMRGPSPLIYTVAEHSVYVAMAAVEDAPPYWGVDHLQCLALHALLHDAPEAYCGDAISPLKAAMRNERLARRARLPRLLRWWAELFDSTSDYDAVEARLAAAVSTAFGLGAAHWPQEVGVDLPKIHALVKDADMAVYAAECAALRRWRRDAFVEHHGSAWLYDHRWSGRIAKCTPRDAKAALVQALDVALYNPNTIATVFRSHPRAS